jgi:hypothetical protein
MKDYTNSVKQYRWSDTLKYKISVDLQVYDNYTSFNESSACQLVYKLHLE